MHQPMNTITFKMNGQTLLHDVPEYVKNISQFKNSILRDYPEYNYGNLLVCYLRQGHDIMPYDDDLINFNRIYYVIIKPIVCNEHSHSNNNSDSNNNSLIINFDNSDSEDDSEDDEDDSEDDEDDSEDEDDTDEEMPELIDELDDDMPEVY